MQLKSDKVSNKPVTQAKNIGSPYIGGHTFNRDQIDIGSRFNSNNTVTEQFDILHFNKSKEEIKSEKKEASDLLTQFKNELKKQLKQTGAKISAFFSSIFNKKDADHANTSNKIQKLDMSDSGKDVMHAFGDDETVGYNGRMILFDKKISKDGKVEYYRNDVLVKTIYADGSCEIFATARTKTDGVIGRNLNEDLEGALGGAESVVFYPDGSKIYKNEHQRKIRTVFADGSYETYIGFRNEDGELEYATEEKHNADGSYKIYDVDEGIVYLKEEHAKDGSYKKYNEVHQVLEELDNNGRLKVYTNMVWDKETRTIVRDDFNLRLASEITPDGEEYKYHVNKDGSYEVTCTDGSYKKYYESGVLRAERTADGQERKYYANGNLKEETTLDGQEKYYYENGNPFRINNSDGSTVLYYSNGNLQEERNQNGVTKYGFDGTLRRYEGADGSLKEYYEDGSSVVKNTDGSTASYDSQGRLKYQYDSNGYGASYYENGNIQVAKNSEGEISYYEDGRKSQERLNDGSTVSYLYYNTGELSSYTISKPDESYVEYTPDGSMKSKFNRSSNGEGITTNADGTVTRIDYPDGTRKEGYTSMVSANGQTIYQYFDAYGNLYKEEII